MICRNCNKRIKDDSLFCPYCGLIPTMCADKKEELILKPIGNKRISKSVHCILPILSIAVICFWFIKTIVLKTSGDSGAYSVNLSLSFFMKSFTLIAVGVAVVSFAIRIYLFIKKDKRNVILYIISAFSDVLSLGSIIFKLMCMKIAVSNATYDILTAADFSLNVWGWGFVFVCTVSVLLHLLLIIFKKTEGNC